MFMAKGRQLTTSRSERLLGSYNGFNGGGGGGGGGGGEGEFREDDIWASYGGGGGGGYNQENHFGNGSLGELGSRAASEYSGSRHQLPRGDNNHHRQVGGLSLAFDDSDGTATRIVHQYRAHESGELSPRGRHMAMSAPMNVPDWSKIYRVDSVESLHDSDGGDEHEPEWLPPHEYVAREHARSRRTTAGSVFEGVGRTLKGRDLSRVRDAVWSQTGFDG